MALFKLLRGSHAQEENGKTVEYEANTKNNIVDSITTEDGTEQDLTKNNHPAEPKFERIESDEDAHKRKAAAERSKARAGAKADAADAKAEAKEAKADAKAERDADK